MKKVIISLLIVCSLRLVAGLPSEITLSLKLDYSEAIVGERVRCTVDVANASADDLDGGHAGSPDALILELFRASDMRQYDKIAKKPFVEPFTILSGEGQKFETFIGDYFPMEQNTRYLVRAVLIHRKIRYESSYKSLDVVPGMRLTGAMQMFANDQSIKRIFEIVYWGRNRVEHAFLKAHDEMADGSQHRWTTVDLGTILRVTSPKISVMPNGEVVTLHRANQDIFVRSVFWSMPKALVFRENENMTDPEVAAAERMKQLYIENGGVEPERKAWWKFW